MKAGRPQYLAGEISDHELSLLAEAEGREFAVVTFTQNGQTRRLLTAGRAGDVGVAARNEILYNYPGATIDRVVHTHPPGSIASNADLRYASKNGALDTIMRDETGRLTRQTITQQEARAELLRRDQPIPLEIIPE
jgi:hypothetical protein